ncbi:MAG: hypothetical protein IJY61_05705 [Candidatus Gastranaerophilales bacterium]|nr:hypothetical protein [Candidatus Gastranaerophilales bacterium]
MVDVSKIGAVQQNVYNSELKAEKEVKEEDLSLFNGEEFYSVQILQNQLAEINSSNGFIGEGWDDIKNGIGLGLSSDDCEDAIQQYKQGKISFEEAEAKINEYKTKQDGSVNLFSNIATGVAAILAGTAVATTGGLATPLVAGILAGAGMKAGVKTVDRATNKVEGDALDGKQIAKDALSGAVTGGIAVATAGTGGGAFNEGFTLGGKKLIEGGTKACMANSAKIGVTTGAISGASNNLIECAFEEDKEFNFKDFATETATSALTGATVGAIMGGVNGTLRSHDLLKHGGAITTETTQQDTAANIACNIAYKGTNNFVKNTAHFLKASTAA